MFRFTLFAAALGVTVACGPKLGGPASGAADSHCGPTDVVVTDPAVCQMQPTPNADAGADPVTVVRYNTIADDDDCKYHVSYAVSPVSENADVSFTATVTKKSDGSAASGADAVVEAFLSDTHPAPNSGQKTTEVSPGVYTIGPVRFDAPGQWTVKFHLYESCTDVAATSPHGHVSFYVNVP
jgi:hypothetical protein